MTKINRISIHGFKSFAHKTEILFEDKYNVIMGPNGSGKSNVGDAICFVLGRISAKAMRAEKGVNLIFNGGKRKKPADKGTVEIVFDNSQKIFPEDEGEIIISRTITKNGTSVYRINGKKRTRSEILDFLAAAKINPEGYNIILQGDITRFVDMSVVERRKVIEDISDVSIYEEKKHKALLELEKVEDKLNNAGIILKERKTYLRELKKDRDQALAFKETKDKIDSSKATHLNIQIKNHTKNKDQYDSQVSENQNKIKELEQKIDRLKQEVEKNRTETKELNKEIEQKGEKEQVKVHRQLEELKINLAENKTRRSTLKDELTKIDQRGKQFQEELAEHDQKISHLEKEKIDLQKQNQSQIIQQKVIEDKINHFKKKNNLEDARNLDGDIEELDKTIEQKQEEIQKIRQEQQDFLREKDRLEYQLSSLDERISKTTQVEKENKTQIQDLKNKKGLFKDSTLRLNRCLEQDSDFASRIAKNRKRLQLLQEDEAKSRAKSLSAQAKVFQNMAVKKILERKATGVYGTISQLGKVNKKYSFALENAAGGRTNNVVVETDKVAVECINFLKKNKFGSASFIPLNKIRSVNISSEEKKLAKLPGVHDFALGLIEFDPRYHNAFAYVFGNTLIVDDINTARKVGIGKVRMATLDGDLAESSGVMRGGFRQKTTGVAFQEKDSQSNLKKIEFELGEVQALISALETERTTNEQEISSLRNSRSELEADIIKMEKTLHLDSSDLDATNDQKKEINQKLKEIEGQLTKIQGNISIINKELAEIKIKRQAIKNEISQSRDPRLLAQLSAFEESKTKFREELATFKNEIKNIDLKINDLIIPEKNKILDILKQHQREKEEFNQEIIDLKNKIMLQEKDLKEKERESQEFYARYKSLFNQREKLTNDITKKEETVDKIRSQKHNFEIENNKVSLKNAEVKAKLAALEEEFSRYKDSPLLKNRSEEELRKEINKFELMLSQMSAVNMKALEIYEQVETEYQKLLEKKDSLHNEQKDIAIMMNEIEGKKKEQFLKTFNTINKGFQQTFSMMFKKGTAFLELGNPQKPFEGGLNIKVRLTGQRYMDIKSLSGGEKTLTALSFIFAIQEYQPASFYVLDEIDAALDKHNAETLAKLIRAYSTKAQYVVVSHNDSVISEADTLYGVSMDTEGVSKVTSLKL